MLFFKSASRTPAPQAPVPTEIAGVPVRVSTRARRMSLRVEAKTGQVVLTVPQRKNWTAKMQAAAQSFVADNRDWIAKQAGAAAAAEKIDLVPGTVLEILGEPVTLVHLPGRGITRRDGGQLIVCGQPEYFARRVRDYLKTLALDTLSAATHEKARRLGLPPRDVTVRDPASRWGSCGPDGRIMYSWRLVLAPPVVMDYVVAHEVAHRVHLDHSRAFWRLCLSLCDTGEGLAAKRWLKRHGATVMRV